MSTPTPSAPPNPSSASKRATNHPTPSHLNHSSPAPRSVPSPAATRKDLAGKTPTNPLTTSSSQGSRTLGGTPMVSSLSASNGATAPSPAGGLLGFGTPGGMGLGLGVDMGTPALGGALVPTMSELGLMQSGGQKRNEDEERRVRLRRILKTIGRPRGRVSEEGIARVARRVGFANDIDAENLTAEERVRKVGNRTISIGGNALVLEVSLVNQEPRRVEVTFSSGLVDTAGKVGEVLLRHLRGEGGRLEEFARDLEWLARVDRVSGQRVDCFAALSGVMGTLARLWEEEVKGARESGRGEGAEMEVMCKRSGRPVSHEDGRLGLAIRYWSDDRPTSPKKHDENAMDVDTPHPSPPDPSDQGPYSLRIVVERSSPSLYPPIRTSDAWLPTPLSLSPLQPLPWQDPPQTFLPPDPDAMTDDNSQKLPDLRFLAILDPPVVMPWQTATNILHAVGAPSPQPFAAPQLYHTLLLGLDANVPVSDSMVSAQQDVLTINGDGVEQEVHHSYRLGISKPDFGFRLEELPFSHPRQLVELLPTLRQWACTGALLKRTFNPENFAKDESGGGGKVDGGALDRLLGKEVKSETGTDRLGGERVPVDITLTTSPTPTLGPTFPSKDEEGKNVAVAVEVLPNGDFGVSAPVFAGEGGDGDGCGGQGKRERERRMARALGVVGEVGVWVEWVRGGGP